MQIEIGVRFKKAGKIYSFAPGNLELKKGDHVVVETARGLEMGEVVIGPRETEEKDGVTLKVVQRKATEADESRVRHNKEHAKEAFVVGEQKIAEHGLPMKLVDVEYTFDMNKVIFYFTADGRVDFRELVKDLASVFRTRIELRQIGVRDEAKLMGGIGCCGRPLCCATFLGDFAPVSIRMAKEQNLSLNPAKISGICGRLMCCLKYESNCYCGGCPKRQKAQAPEQGSLVVLEQGEGKVIATNAQRRTATILLTTGRTVVAPWDEIAPEDTSVTPEFAATATTGARESVAESDGGSGRAERRPRQSYHERNDRSGERRERRESRPRDGEGERRENREGARRHPKGKEFQRSRQKNARPRGERRYDEEHEGRRQGKNFRPRRQNNGQGDEGRPERENRAGSPAADHGRLERGGRPQGASGQGTEPGTGRGDEA